MHFLKPVVQDRRVLFCEIYIGLSASPLAFQYGVHLAARPQDLFQPGLRIYVAPCDRYVPLQLQNTSLVRFSPYEDAGMGAEDRGQVVFRTAGNLRVCANDVKRCCSQCDVGEITAGLTVLIGSDETRRLMLWRFWSFEGQAGIMPAAHFICCRVSQKLV